MLSVLGDDWALAQLGRVESDPGLHHAEDRPISVFHILSYDLTRSVYASWSFPYVAGARSSRRNMPRSDERQEGRT